MSFLTPPHIPWKGQTGDLLLLRYSMICVSGLAIFDVLSKRIYDTGRDLESMSYLGKHPSGYQQLFGGNLTVGTIFL